MVSKEAQIERRKRKREEAAREVAASRPSGARTPATEPFRPVGASPQQFFIPEVEGPVSREEFKEKEFETERMRAEKFAAPVGPTPLEKQEEILAEQEARRAGEELPAEQLPPITEPVIEEPTIGERLFGTGEGVYFNPITGKPLLSEGKPAHIAAGTVPLGPAGGAKLALSSARVLTSTRATKAWTGMLKFLKSNVTKKLGKYGALGYALWSERTMQNIDSALSQVRESITLPVQLAATNPLEIQNSFDKLTELEADVRGYESDVKVREPFAITAQVSGRTLPIYQRIKKLDDAILLGRQQIAKIAAEGIIPTDEETALMLSEINSVIGNMEEPIKFLGLI